MEFLEFFDLLSGLLIALAFSLGLVLLRLMRLRKWKQALARPASQFAAQNQKLKVQLPPGVRLDTKEPLFEVLYLNYKLQPGRFAPGAVNQVLSGSLVVGPPPVLGSSDRLSAEEKVQSLLSAQSTSQSGGAPVHSLAQNLVVNLVSVMTGKKNLKAGVEHAVLDSLGAGGGFAGAKLGGVVGVALVPMLAGAAAAALPVLMIFGAWAGSILGKQMGARMKSRHRYAALKKWRRALLDLKRCFLLRIPELRVSLDREYERNLVLTRELRQKRQGFFGRGLYPDLMSVFLQQSMERTERDWAADQKQWNQIRRKIRSMPPLDVADVLRRLSEAGTLVHPDLAKLYSEYEVALAELKKADQIAA